MLPDDPVTPSQAARLLAVATTTVYRWIETGELHAWRVGGRYRLSRREVLGMAREVQIEEPVRTTAQDEEAADAALRRMGHRRKGE